MRSEAESLRQFIIKRNEIIEKLDNGEISKDEFLEENYILLNRLSMKPFLKIDIVEKGIYNYQYYNILAKYHNNLANSSNGKNMKVYKREINKVNNYYYEKDRVVLETLELMNYEEIESYYIELYSKRLKNSIFEIVLINYEKAIFHSMNKDISNILTKKNILKNEIRQSKIHSYVNNGE